LETAQVSLEDDQGAEIDTEIFPFLLEQTSTPNIVFHVDGDQPPVNNLFDNSPTPGSQIIYGKI
jgi:hypothetical protein